MRRIICILALLSAALLQGCACVEKASAKRDAAWAQKVEITGVPNCHVIEPGLYRSALPTRAGLTGLEEQGIANVLSLCEDSKDNILAYDTMLRCHNVPMNPFEINDDDVVEALSIMKCERNRPLLIHCYHGADRTGLICAMYRIVMQGWTKEQALQEMRFGGYGFHRFCTGIIEYIQNADIETIRNKMVKKRKSNYEILKKRI